MSQDSLENPADPKSSPAAPPFISGVILAAGRSRRMKEQGPKQLLRHEGRTLLEHVVHRATESDLDELIIVLGYRAEAILESLALFAKMPIRVTVAPDFEMGQSRSLDAGLQAADSQAKAAAILLGDQPDLPTATINLARDAWLKRRPLLLRPEYTTSSGGKQPGHPVMICRKIWPIIRRLEGDQGAREIIRTHPDWLEALPLPGAAPQDIDRSEDWKAWVESR
ncbi:MAG: nucleotidyltransferase family protein [Myxococcota bacterium]|nr:nucleotidyltransferase family protein [Myxococcota bacterium]